MSENSILDMTKPDDCLRWALVGLELLANGLRGRRHLAPNDPEMMNLISVRKSIENAREALALEQVAACAECALIGKAACPEHGAGE